MSAIDTLLELREEIVVFKDVNDKICVEYKNGFISDGLALIGNPGRGDTFDEACREYIRNIQGKTLVFDGSYTKRKEVKVLFVEGENAT